MPGRNGPGRNGADVADELKRRAAKRAPEADRLETGLQGLVEEAKAAWPDLARKAEQLLQDNADRLKSQSKEAAAAANEQLETARTYVVERVQERPFTTTLAVLGAGFLLGLLFAGRRR